MIMPEAIFYIIIIFFIIIIVGFYFYLFKKPQETHSIKDLYSEGLDMLVAGQLKSAYRNFKEIINQDSNNIRAYLHLGQVLREGGKSKQALKVHQNLLYRKDLSKYEKIDLYKNLVFDYEKLGSNDQSIKFCNKILEIDDKNEWSINYLIKLYRNNDNWSNAIECLKLIFKLRNKVDNHLLALYKVQKGRSILNKNKFDKSREIFEKALDIDSNLYITYFFIGNTYKDESNYMYNKFIKLKEGDDPDTLEKEEKLQKYKANAENLLNKAIPMWIHFIENMPAYSWLILSTLKDALQALNRYNDIEKILIQIKNKNSNNIDIISHLADFYANKGEIDKALETIASGLEKNPNSLIAQLKKIKINALKKDEKDTSSEVDKLIQSLLKDTRYIKYKHNFVDKDLKWLFENDYDNQ